jgi:purine-binding chemotaxis protein CheW
MSAGASAVAQPGGGAVLTLRSGGETLSLPLAEVMEILQPRPLTRVPHGPPSLLGLANLRGVVVPVISLSALLGAGTSPVTAASRLVLVSLGAPVALLADGVVMLAETSGARLLELRELLARDFAALLRRSAAVDSGIAPAMAAPATASADRALVCFDLAGQDYALPMSEVAEIARLPQDVAALPRTDAAMLGVTAFRGGLLPLVSLRALVGLPAAAPDPAQACLVVTRLAGGGRAGLVVDDLRGLLRVPEAAIDPVPPVLTRGKAEARVAAICRVDDGRRLVSLLEPAYLLDGETAERLRGAVQGEAMAMSGEAMEESGAVEQFVLFQLGGEAYGLPIAAVEEVVRHPGTLTRIPRAPDFLEGVMNLRGSVMPVIDQHRRFAAQGAAAPRRRIVVVRLDGLLTGFAVDTVSEIVGIPAAALSATPGLAAEGSQVFGRVAITGADGRMVLIVDPQALLDQAERDLLAAIAEAAPGP